MNRLVVFCFAVMFFFGVGSTRSEAAVIQCFDPAVATCQPIGLFSWDVDATFGDDIFTVTNLTDPSTGADFEAVDLTVDTVVTSLGTIGPASQADTLGVMLVFSSLQADLAFGFQSAAFALSLSAPGVTSIYAEEVVTAPEPSLVLLMLSGTVGLHLVRRRRRV